MAANESESHQQAANNESAAAAKNSNDENVNVDANSTKDIFMDEGPGLKDLSKGKENDAENSPELVPEDSKIGMEESPNDDEIDRMNVNKSETKEENCGETPPAKGADLVLETKCSDSHELIPEDSKIVKEESPNEDAVARVKGNKSDTKEEKGDETSLETECSNSDELIPEKSEIAKAKSPNGDEVDRVNSNKSEIKPEIPTDNSGIGEVMPVNKARNEEKKNEEEEEMDNNSDEDDNEEDLSENVELIKFPEDSEDDNEMILPHEERDIVNHSWHDGATDTTESQNNIMEVDEIDKDGQLSKNDKQTTEVVACSKESDTHDGGSVSLQGSQNKSMKGDDMEKQQKGCGKSNNDEEGSKEPNDAIEEVLNTEQGPNFTEVVSNSLTEETELVVEYEEQTTEDNADDELVGTDPLEQAASQEAIQKSNEITANDTDDDDVEIIETRNSPICLIDSDTDEEQQEEIIKLPTKEVTITRIPANTSGSIPTTTYTKKSTEMPHISSELKRKAKNMSYLERATKRRTGPEHLVATIDLVESSDNDDGEATSSPSQTSGGPTKRNGLSESSNLLKSTNHRYRSSRYWPIRSSTTSPGYVTIQPRTHPYVATPQSNFLNAVNLQPTNAVRQSPSACAAKTSNTGINIPHAYGNHNNKAPHAAGHRHSSSTSFAGTKSADPSSQHKIAFYKRWLENFVANFFSPKQITTESCFTLLGRVLNSQRMLVCLREMRSKLNRSAEKGISEALDLQLMIDLRCLLFTKDRNLSSMGYQLSRMACSNKAAKGCIVLCTDAKTGAVTSRTETLETLMCSLNQENSNAPPSTPKYDTRPTSSNSSISSHTSVGPNEKDLNSAVAAFAATTSRKRQRDDDEYTPKALVHNSAENSDESKEERRRSLRANRKRRYDEHFTYNEDADEQEFDDEEVDEGGPASMTEEQLKAMRYVEAKRLEAQQQIQQKAKSFESAFIETFSKSIKSTHAKKYVPESLSTKAVQKDLAARGVECIQIDDDDDYEFNKVDNDEPKQHLIFKPNAPLFQVNCQPTPSVSISAPTKYKIVDSIDISDTSNDGNDNNSNNVFEVKKTGPKNIDRHLHCQSKCSDVCVFCKRRITRIVHHYVNEHPDCEVFNSRLPPKVLKNLKRQQSETTQISSYKNGQLLYDATCLFCQKACRFMLPYWFQHFSMHTGEYAYKCTGCGIRKPTRSLLTAHINQLCPEQGVEQVLSFNPRTTEIKAFVCSFCNYIQLHRSNMETHLRKQHEMGEVLESDFSRITLLNAESVEQQQQQHPQQQQQLMSQAASMGSPGGGLNTLSPSMTRGMWPSMADNDPDFDPSDDLSYTICGMLDVQLNTTE